MVLRSDDEIQASRAEGDTAGGVTRQTSAYFIKVVKTILRVCCCSVMTECCACVFVSPLLLHYAAHTLFRVCVCLASIAAFPAVAKRREPLSGRGQWAAEEARLDELAVANGRGPPAC